MGISISCKKTGRSIDMGYFGFAALRRKVAALTGEPFASHYEKLFSPPLRQSCSEADFEEFDRITEEMIRGRKVPIKVVDFLMQSDCKGRIRYGACKTLLKVIGTYDDGIKYGYAGRKDCAMFKDFKQILQECVDNKCDMVWN